MKSTVFILAAVFVSTLGAADEDDHSTGASGICRITQPQGGRLQNDFLSVTLPSKFVFEPQGPGFVDVDGALGMKVPWERKRKGLLQVGGHRLDGAAAPARAYLFDYGDFGFQPTYLVFPTPGCWEISGSVADGSLTFVVLVEKVGDGPSWRFDGLERGWRATQANVRAQ
jgi:hypothetical protein